MGFGVWSSGYGFRAPCSKATTSIIPGFLAIVARSFARQQNSIMIKSRAIRKSTARAYMKRV